MQCMMGLFDIAGWLFVIENKPDNKNVWFEQLSSKISESFTIEEKPVVLKWSHIISKITAIKENGLVQGSGASLIDNFLEFVWNQFPELNAYNKFSQCKGEETLLKRRCKLIMEESV